MQKCPEIEQERISATTFPSSTILQFTWVSSICTLTSPHQQQAAELKDMYLDHQNIKLILTNTAKGRTGLTASLSVKSNNSELLLNTEVIEEYAAK